MYILALSEFMQTAVCKTYICKTNKKTCETAIHFNASKHAFEDFEFIGIERIEARDNVDRILLTREAFWSAQLCTLALD